MHSAISITPDGDNPGFRGKIVIGMELRKPPTSVTRNAADLSCASASITPADGKIMNATASVNADAQTVTFTFPKHLPAGNYRLDIDYSGKIYRSEEHTSELQSLMRISYAVFCLKKKKLH